MVTADNAFQKAAEVLAQAETEWTVERARVLVEIAIQYIALGTILAALPSLV